jgi:hypothetical protein
MEKQKSQQQIIPQGYCLKADGSMVPEAMVKPIDRMRDKIVLELITQAKIKSAELAEFKNVAHDEIDAFVQLSVGEYGVTVGGKKGNLQLMTFDGQYKILRQIQETLVFDERLQAAKELIDQCIQRWSEGSRDEIRVLVNDAFRVNQQGLIDTKRVLGLKRLSIKDAEWQRAMQAIADSVMTLSSKSYLRFYERDEKGAYKPISLDVAAV